MRALILCLLSLIPVVRLFACLNGEGKTLTSGRVLYLDLTGSIPYGHRFNIYDDNIQKEIQVLDSLYKRTRDLDYLSDKGLLLIIVKRYEEAIKLYLAIEKIKPNRYSTASNLGTAYELTGQNPLALEWIKKAVKINPNSHSKSEWIHVRILESKMQGLSNVNALSLINTDFGNERFPTTTLSKQKLSELSDALYYQLNERMSFIDPKDAIIACLLFEYANINTLLKDYPTAFKSYGIAREYGYPLELVSKRENMVIIKAQEAIGYSARQKRGESSVEDNVNIPVSYLWSIFIVVGILGGATIIIAYKRKKKTRNPE